MTGPGIDRDRLVTTLQELARVPTDVPAGAETLMAPDDPRLVAYTRHEVRPRLEALGTGEVLDAPEHQLLLRVRGERPGPTTLVSVYTPTQHHQQMADPYSGRLGPVPGHPELGDAVFGRGVSQNKVHLAAVLAALEASARGGGHGAGTLLVAVNHEGRSSHACSEALLPVLDPVPDAHVILVCTGGLVSLGNRGRVDVHVTVRGRAGHSSAPEEARSAIEGTRLVLDRLARFDAGEPHPLLGPRHAVPYQLTFAPLAPHTLPGEAHLVVDRRYLPDETPEGVVAGLRESLADVEGYDVEVTAGVTMRPALVDPGEAIVRDLTAAIDAAGRAPVTGHLRGAFDAGIWCDAGIPTLMWGVGGPPDVLGDDYVTVDDAVHEAEVLVALLRRSRRDRRRDPRSLPRTEAGA